jgi:FixJ family two-component response regulator
MEKKYKAVVIDDHKDMRDFMVEALRAKNFDARGYGEAEKVLTGFEGVSLSEQPDLIVVDLMLEENKMQGIDLVAELVDKDVSAEILVISGNLGTDAMAESILAGAGARMPKPFEDFRVAIRKMEALADIGKRRRLYRMTGRLQEMDSKRLERPVFLSYSANDKRMANGLRRNLESRDIPVWYAPRAIEGGDVWIKRIEEGVEKAIIFVALVTESYLGSAHCFGELIGFQSRLESAHEPELLLLPLLCVSREEVSKNQSFGPILQDFQGIDFSRGRVIDGLTILLARIQDRLRRPIADIDNKSASTVELIAKPSSQDKIA